MVKLLKGRPPDIFCTSKNTRGSNNGWDYKGTTNANPVNDYSKQNSQASDRTKDNIFLENRKMTERMASG